MTQEEFTSGYVRHQGINRAELYDRGIFPYPCICGIPGCQGWQMLNPEEAAAEKRLGHLPANVKILKATKKIL